MSNIDSQIRITPALEKGQLTSSSNLGRESEGKLQLVLFGFLRLLILAGLIYCVLSAAAS